jgi:hypothetical protein
VAVRNADQVDRILDVLKDVVVHEIALEDLRERLADASKRS